MANVILFHTNKEPEYLVSVNTPEYSVLPNCVVNPDLSALTNVPKKFWKRSGNNVVEMTTAEKQAVLDKEATDKLAREDNFSDLEAITLARALVKLGVVTKEQLKTTIRSL